MFKIFFAKVSNKNITKYCKRLKNTTKWWIKILQKCKIKTLLNKPKCKIKTLLNKAKVWNKNITKFWVKILQKCLIPIIQNVK